MVMFVRRRANSGSILGIAIRVPDGNTSKLLKIASMSIFGAPTQALNKDSDRMWADEVSSADRCPHEVGRIIDSN